MTGEAATLSQVCERRTLHAPYSSHLVFLLPVWSVLSSFLEVVES